MSSPYALQFNPSPTHWETVRLAPCDPSKSPKYGQNDHICCNCHNQKAILLMNQKGATLVCKNLGKKNCGFKRLVSENELIYWTSHDMIDRTLIR